MDFVWVFTGLIGVFIRLFWSRIRLFCVVRGTRLRFCSALWSVQLTFLNCKRLFWALQISFEILQGLEEATHTKEPLDTLKRATRHTQKSHLQGLQISFEILQGLEGSLECIALLSVSLFRKRIGLLGVAPRGHCWSGPCLGARLSVYRVWVFTGFECLQGPFECL